MTRIVVLAVGHPKTPGLDKVRGEYEQRLVHYFRFEAVEVQAASLPDKRAVEARTWEANKLIQRIPDDLDLVALTRTGNPWSTQKLAEYLDEVQTYGHKGAIFYYWRCSRIGLRPSAASTHKDVPFAHDPTAWPRPTLHYRTTLSSRNNSSRRTVP